MIRDAAEQAVISISGKVAAGGSATAVGSGITGKTIQAMSQNPDVAANAMAWADVGVFVGSAVAVVGLLSQTYFNVRRDRRDTRLHNAQMSDMRGRRHND